MITEQRSDISPKVAVVILNWNGKDDTLECLASVGQLDYPNYEVVVVDNGSTDDSVDAISKQFPDITLLQTGANLGYAGGNNVGIRWALQHGANYVLILNNDTVVSTDLLTVFTNAMKFVPPHSVLGAKIYFYDKPDTLWFAGGLWKNQSNSVEHIGYGKQDSSAFNCVTEVDYITGCALFASAETFKEVGLLDERFFLTFEETDWCYRARAIGHKCIVIPEAKLWHKVSSSFGGADSPLISYFITRNKLFWAKKHLPKSARINLHKENLRILRRILLPPLSLANADSPLAKKLIWSFSSWLKTIKRNIGNPTNRATLMGMRDYYLDRSGNCPDQVRELAKVARLLPNPSKLK
ncbi:MAG: glycosyltransferase family 2 protein [Candidatus Nitrotoga sp.]|nr:glycosyltransferase family 2 protein [Candidatus Nitrotoga sp.]